MKIMIEGTAEEVAEFVKAIVPNEVFVDAATTTPMIHLGEIPHGDGPLGTPAAQERPGA